MPHWLYTVLALVAVATPAQALPAAGAILPAVAVDDVQAGRPRPLPSAHPILVLYEDREAAPQNAHARQVLGKINDVEANRERFEFVAIADVAAWSWWPAKPAVVSDLKKISQRENTRVYADWSGAVRHAWGLRAHQSVFVLADAEGKVRFASEGALSEEQLQALIGQLRLLGVH